MGYYVPYLSCYCTYLYFLRQRRQGLRWTVAVKRLVNEYLIDANEAESITIPDIMKSVIQLEPRHGTS